MSIATAPVQAPRLIIPILSAANFVIGMGAFVVIGLINPISDDLSISPARTGALMTTYALAYAVLSPVLVSVTGHIGRRRMLAFGLGLFALANLASAFAPDKFTLHLSRIAAAAGAGLTTPVTAAVAAGLSAPEQRGKALAAVFVGLTLAQVFGVPAGAWLGYALGWRAAFLIVALLAIPSLWLIWTRVPAGLAFQSVGLSDLGRTLLNGPVMLAILFTTTFLGAVYVVYTYLAPLLSDTMAFGRDGITLALLVFGIGAVLGNIIGGRLADGIGPFRTLLLLSMLQVVIMPLFSLLPLPIWSVFALLGIWSVCGWSFMAAQQLRIIGLLPEGASVILALNAAAIYVGAAVGSAIGGATLSHWDLGALGVTAGACALCAVVHMVVSRAISGR